MRKYGMTVLTMKRQVHYVLNGSAGFWTYLYGVRCVAELLPGAPLLSVPYGDSGARIGLREDDDDEELICAVENERDKNDDLDDVVGVRLPAAGVERML